MAAILLRNNIYFYNCYIFGGISEKLYSL